jgi:hypothetical protein
MAIGFSIFVSSQKKPLRNLFVLLRNPLSLSIVAPCDWRHPDFGSRLGTFRLKSLANDRIFVLVFDLPAAIGERHIGLNFTGLKLVFAAEDFERCDLLFRKLRPAQSLRSLPSNSCRL